MNIVFPDIVRKRTAVNRAAAVLDVLAPDWASRVDTEQLEMYNINRCILGQVFASQYRYPHASGYGYGKALVLDVDPTVYTPVFACSNFQDLWCQAIAARLNTPPVATWTHRERVEHVVGMATVISLCLAGYLL